MNRIFLTSITFILTVLFSCGKEDFPPINADKKPVIGELKTFNLPDVKKFKMDNGLNVYLVENDEVPLVSVTAVFNAGFVDDPTDKKGLAYYTMKMLTQGVRNKNSAEFASDLDLYGAFLVSDANLESSVLRMVVLRDNLVPVLTLFSQAIQDPALSDDDWQKLRSLEQEKIASVVLKENTLAEKLFRQVVYGAHPYSIYPHPDNAMLNRIEIGDIREFYRKYINSSNCTLIFSGDISPKEVNTQISQLFSNFQKGSKNRHDYSAPPQKNLVKIHFISIPESKKAVIKIGKIGIDYSDPNLYGAIVMNEILAGNPSSRLPKIFDSQLKKDYKIFTRLELRNQPGPFYFSGIFDKEDARSVINMVFREMDSLRTAAPALAELEHAQKLLVGKFYMGTETSDQIAVKVHHLVEYNLSRDFLNLYGKKINEIKTPDVLKSAKEIVNPDEMTIVVASDPAIIDSLLSIAPVIKYHANLQRY